MTDPAVPTDPPEIPDKLFFRIGEVADLLAVEPYVLRYWETEFPSLAPKKSGTGHRLYRRKDVELLLKIKHLLYEKRYTIEGARQSLHNDSKTKAVMTEVKQRDLFTPDPLPVIRAELASILQILKNN
ncbi:MAG TPA: MerR family transcriptional regulator [Bryobacteraceae bacterium]|jgi:DNA-binding transcriptional MerR regulator|nr:MerR family transcriptional regulator [Bryobacteraceae bacterium]